MYLTHLSLSKFRNFTRLDWEVPGGLNLLLGSNAQGKTSLLEAIFYLATFESFHASSDRQLINQLAMREPLAVARIVAEIQFPEAALTASPAARKKTRRIEVSLIQDKGQNGSGNFRKEIKIDGVKKKVHEALGSFNAILFLPQMLQIVEGPPEERRRYLNLAISQAHPAYARDLHEYGQVLGQRNALLKNLNEHSVDMSASEAQLSYWDERLAYYGARVIHQRIRAVQELEQLASHVHLELTRKAEVLRLLYKISYEQLPDQDGQYKMLMDVPLDSAHVPLEKIQEDFQLSLKKKRFEEIARGITLFGPHRDELVLLANGNELRYYCSRGQARTTVLSLKLAEVAWMKEQTGQWPVLLLDEVLAELDPARRVDLLTRLGASEQVLLTTTELDRYSGEFIHQSRLWQVQAGAVDPLPPASSQ